MTNRLAGAAEDAGGVFDLLPLHAHLHAGLCTGPESLLERLQRLSLKVRGMPGPPGKGRHLTALMSMMPRVERPRRVTSMMPGATRPRRVTSMMPGMSWTRSVSSMMFGVRSRVGRQLCARATRSRPVGSRRLAGARATEDGHVPRPLSLRAHLHAQLLSGDEGLLERLQILSTQMGCTSRSASGCQKGISLRCLRCREQPPRR